MVCESSSGNVYPSSFEGLGQKSAGARCHVQVVVYLAMVAPDVLDAIASGEQPIGHTSDTLINSGVPACWSEQRKQFAKL